MKLSHLASGIDSATCAQTTETRLADLLDNTLWNRRLAPSSERIVYALVQQIFHGIREYFLASAELKVCAYVCWFSMNLSAVGFLGREYLPIDGYFKHGAEGFPCIIFFLFKI